MKQTISLSLLTCAVLLSVPSMHAMNKVHTNGKSQPVSSSLVNNNVDAQTKLNNDKVLFEASQNIAIDAFAHEVAEIFATNTTKTVVDQTMEDNFEAQIKAAIKLNSQFATGKTWGDTFNSLKKWSKKDDEFKSKVANLWIDSLVFVSVKSAAVLPQDKQTYIKDILKAHAVAIFDAQVRHFAPKKEAVAKNAWQTRFNFNKLSRATLGLGFTALAGIVLYLNYKFGTKTHPFPTKLPTKISTINFKVPFYSRS